MKRHSFLAFDLGAESGRTVLGSLDQGRLRLQTLNRFPNGMLEVLDHWHWNIFRLFEEMKKGMSGCVLEAGIQPESLAIDTWGVDFGLLAADGSILGLPFSYRDPRTSGAVEEFCKVIPRERVYQLTGIQFLQFNTLFQLYAMKREASPLLEAASDLLFIPDIFDYIMTGTKKTEFTFATTSQLFNPIKGGWEEELFEAMGVSLSLMQAVIPPGTVVGRLNENICSDTGLNPVPVVAVASHDTGSAVAAVPAEGQDWAYISSGTWSLIGIVVENPILSDKTLHLNFTNEGGLGGTFRFLKNITGLWLLQECRRTWSADREVGYEELTSAARSAQPFAAFIDPDWSGFLKPLDMPEAIRTFCGKTRQRAPVGRAEFVRCILESLALKYRQVLGQIQEVAPRPVGRIHIIGGGARNRLLCQFTANATGLPVVAGPIEATAAGNILVQALCLGYVRTPTEIREIVSESFDLDRYEPEKRAEWEAAYQRFEDILTNQESENPG